jgi:uncharacterized Rmd1/YagE family protein
MANAPALNPETSPAKGRRISARTMLLGDRIDTNGLERSDMLSSTPLAFYVAEGEFVVIFRYGAVVMFNMSPLKEDEFLRAITHRVSGAYEKIDEETIQLELAPDREDHIVPGGHISLTSHSPDRLLLVADTLAKSSALGRDEYEVSAVLDLIEPFARDLASSGRTPGGRHAILKLIGQSLLVQHRMSARVAVEEKPDVLWDRSDLERFFARLEDEYELRERAANLNRKVDVIRETAQALTDLIDTQRSLRLEIIVVLLIGFEILLSFYQIFGERFMH